MTRQVSFSCCELFYWKPTLVTTLIFKLRLRRNTNYVAGKQPRHGTIYFIVRFHAITTLWLLAPSLIRSKTLQPHPCSNVKPFLYRKSVSFFLYILIFLIIDVNQITGTSFYVLGIKIKRSWSNTHKEKIKFNKFAKTKICHSLVESPN